MLPVCPPARNRSIRNDATVAPSVGDRFQYTSKHVYINMVTIESFDLTSDPGEWDLMRTDIFRDALAGKSVLVTGCGSGLGKEICKTLLAKGATVHICGRREAVLDAAVAEAATFAHWSTT
jgi:FlaA1/EpsC-like NDP-sugar epimerase